MKRDELQTEYIMKMKKLDKKKYWYEQQQVLVRCKNCRFREDPYSVTSEWLPCQFRKTADEWFCASGREK